MINLPSLSHLTSQLSCPTKRVKSKLAKLLTAGLAALVLIVLQTASTQAQSGTRELIAMPPRAGHNGELSAAPGEKIQTTIRFRNGSDQPINIRSFAKDFIIKEDGTTPIPVMDTVSNRWSLASWMVVTPNYHELAPGETVEMQVLIEVPEDALPGGHYAMVIHEPTTLSQTEIERLQQGMEGSGAAVTQQVSTLFYVIVEGPINEEAYVRQFKFNNFQEFGPVPYSFTVSNQSDIHIRPRMNIDIFNMIGQKSDSIMVEPRNVFPLNSRDFAGKWDKIWGLGLYKAKLTMSYGDTGQVVIATDSFWIVPVRIIIAVIFTLVVLIAVVTAVRRHIKHREEEEQARIKELQQKVDQYEQQEKSAQTQEKSKQAKE